jgi:hypothetical protein
MKFYEGKKGKHPFFCKKKKNQYPLVSLENDNAFIRDYESM